MVKWNVAIAKNVRWMDLKKTLLSEHVMGTTDTTASYNIVVKLLTLTVELIM